MSQLIPVEWVVMVHEPGGTRRFGVSPYKNGGVQRTLSDVLYHLEELHGATLFRSNMVTSELLTTAPGADEDAELLARLES